MIKYAESGKKEAIMWQVPQYILLGVGEAFTDVSMSDFFGSQVPDSMRSCGIALALSSPAVGNYLCSWFLKELMKFTTRNGGGGWIPCKLNDGSLEYYFFVVAGIGAIELVVYVMVVRCVWSASPAAISVHAENEAHQEVEIMEIQV